MLNFMITPGDVDDRKPLDYKPFVEFLYGKPVGINLNSKGIGMANLRIYSLTTN